MKCARWWFPPASCLVPSALGQLGARKETDPFCGSRVTTVVFSYWPASTGACPMQILSVSAAELHHSDVCGHLNIP